MNARRQQFRSGQDVDEPVFPPWTSGRIVPNSWCIWASCQQLAWRWKVIQSHLATTTLQALQDPRKRPSVPRDPLPREVLEHQPEGVIELDQERLLRNLRSARRGAAGGPSGTTAEHLRPLLDSHRDGQRFWRVCEGFARAEMPIEVLQALRIGRMTALQKPTGGVRGIVVGDFVRRLVARTLAQQLGPAVESATAPFQFALSTKAGGECVAHVAQALTDMDDNATLLSVDGIGAFDLVSRGAMMSGLLEVEGGASALPFVRQFYGSPSTYLWDDDDGVTHEIAQGEGGEQVDALMPLLFSLGLHRSLCAVSDRLLPTERLLAFLDDLYVICSPERVSHVYRVLQEELWVHSRIQMHHGKTQVWNRARVPPTGLDAMTAAARTADPTTIVWRGDPSLPSSKQGMKILGTPLGHPDYVQSQLRSVTESHQILFERIPCVCVLLYCAGTRANYLLRAVPQVRQRSTQWNTMVQCDAVCADCWNPTFLMLHGKWRISRSPLEGWDCGTVPG